MSINKSPLKCHSSRVGEAISSLHKQAQLLMAMRGEKKVGQREVDVKLRTENGNLPCVVDIN